MVCPLRGHGFIEGGSYLLLPDIFGRFVGDA